MKPNIYECKICGEHHCEHDFHVPEEEDDFRMFPIILQPPPKKHSQAQINGLSDKSSNSSPEQSKEAVASCSKSQDVED